jgi:hypothetical protein
MSLSRKVIPPMRRGGWRRRFLIAILVASSPSYGTRVDGGVSLVSETERR